MKAFLRLFKENFDMLSMSETKLDHSFTNTEFLIPGFLKHYLPDIHSRSRGILVYVKPCLPSKAVIKISITHTA